LRVRTEDDTDLMDADGFFGDALGEYSRGVAGALSPFFFRHVEFRRSGALRRCISDTVGRSSRAHDDLRGVNVLGTLTQSKQLGVALVEPVRRIFPHPAHDIASVKHQRRSASVIRRTADLEDNPDPALLIRYSAPAVIYLGVTAVSHVILRRMCVSVWLVPCKL
jgi:hypothetical protein